MASMEECRMETMSIHAQTLQEAASIIEFFNAVATETLTLFEHHECKFFDEFDIFAPIDGQTREYYPPELF